MLTTLLRRLLFSYTFALNCVLYVQAAAEDPVVLKRSPSVDAIEAIEKLGGTYSYRQPSKEFLASLAELGYDPRCYWEIGRVTLGPSSGQNTEPITDKSLNGLHDHLLALRTITILDLDHTEISNEGLLCLPPLPNLRHLRIGGTKLGNGLSTILSRFPDLETLEVFDADFSAEEWVAIVKRFPALKIKKRSR